MRKRSLLSHKQRQGAALVIVLAFVVLLTGLIMAFFSRSLSERQVSNSSASQTQVDFLAQGAVDQIVGDLKQEIAASGSATVVASGTLYLSGSNVVPCPVTTLSGNLNSALPNLLKRSAYNQPFFTTANYPQAGNYPPSSRAINLSSTSAALNARYIPLDRWNKPLLMPIASATNYAPPSSANFIAPDWILLTRGGANPVQSAVNSPSDLRWSATSASSVVGRYAYAIYDEGGLLDANVAGYPSNTTTDQLAGKPALAYADLTKIGLTGTQVDVMVGWRNFASANASGKLPEYTFSGSNYYQSVLSNMNGFLSVSGSVNNNQTDRLFTSRQELIRFAQASKGLNLTGTALNALNYLTHFSRDLNQPSFIKPQSVQSSLPGYDPSAPQIQTTGSGGNNQSGLDAYVNPAFPAVRVQKAFVRNDGSTAVVGEPLVKQRFALKRLAWLTYQGPSFNRAQTDPDIQALINTHGIPYSYLQQGTAQNIKKYFGLTWVADSGSQLGKWVYNVHNGTLGSGSTGAILRLGIPGDSSTGISGLTAPREPDFFELLKAAINAGSKAKTSIAFGGSTLNPLGYQAQYDISFDYAVMQIGANIICQSRVDGYGVRIVFNDGVLPVKEFYGVENNPYLYRVRWGLLKVRTENPCVKNGVNIVPNAAMGAYPAQSGSVGTPSLSGIWGASVGVLVDPGVSMVMLLPEIWNPHDQNAPMPSPSLRPANFRLIADSLNPDNVINGGGTYNQVKALGNAVNDPDHNGSATSGTDAATTGNYGQPAFSRAKGGVGTEIQGSYAGYLNPLTASVTALAFSIPSAALFREPTLLARYNIPSGSNLHIDSSGWSATDAPDADYANLETSTGKSFTSNQGFTADVTNPLVLPTASLVSSTTQYVGIPVGLLPNEWVRSPIITGSINEPGCGMIERSQSISIIGSPYATYRLQFQDPTNASNWITYDSKFTSPAATGLHNILGSGTGGLMQAAPIWVTYTDPRTSRFGGIVPNTSGLSSTAAAKFCGPGAAAYVYPWTAPFGYGYGSSEPAPGNAKEWLDESNDVLISNRPGYDGGFCFAESGVKALSTQAAGWNSKEMMVGMLSQNSLSATNNGNQYSGVFGSGTNSALQNAHYYRDPDDVVRRAMGAYASASTTLGLPMASTLYPGPSAGPANQSQSRPWILHRPFRSVAEIGYVFSGTPWKNLDFFSPESGDAGLLDVFCINETSDSRGVVAGKVNLNTRQAPVLQAILASACRDEQTSGTVVIDPATGGAADQIANALLQRTSGTGKLNNLSELVGKWIPGSSRTAPIDGSATYDGFSKDLSTLLATIYGADSAATNIARFREAALRPLASVGATRVWNLMIDVVAQTGRYPSTVTDLSQFMVEGEQRYWVHIAIDRLTGEVIDKQIEVVKE